MLRLQHGINLREAAAALSEYEGSELSDAPVDPHALRGLKFSEALPEPLASQTVARRLGDLPGAARVLSEKRVLGHT